ncbi:hypothetical protein BDN71DRAFT_733264 [Pleurotus eryngii]|uniref:Uncharacterized protein n=1 Tax=Pleurotus eryngii TaxID=5323 RepID=A0A9P6A3R7_PLEER|nr:hypothetical protein BDN71DRAFT_733264 [Pleurotus eryngii]
MHSHLMAEACKKYQPMQLENAYFLYLVLANAIQESASEVGVPGGTPVDLFPILQYLPSWYPGAHYANMARRWRPEMEKVHTVPFNSVLHQIMWHACVAETLH